MKGTLKDKISNVVAVIISAAGFILEILVPIADGIDGVAELNWMNILVIAGGAIIAALTGRGSDGKSKA